MTIDSKYSTRANLLSMIEAFLLENPDMDAKQFGWQSVRDQTMVLRLREGKDITTHKLDLTIRYLNNNKKG